MEVVYLVKNLDKKISLDLHDLRSPEPKVFHICVCGGESFDFDSSKTEIENQNFITEPRRSREVFQVSVKIRISEMQYGKLKIGPEMHILNCSINFFKLHI